MYQIRFFECPQCYSIVPNLRWDRSQRRRFDGSRTFFKCIGCEEDICFDDWVFKRDEQGIGEYSCPRCGKVWGRG